MSHEVSVRQQRGGTVVSWRPSRWCRWKPTAADTIRTRTQSQGLGVGHTEHSTDTAEEIALQQLSGQPVLRHEQTTNHVGVCGSQQPLLQ